MTTYFLDQIVKITLNLEFPSTYYVYQPAYKYIPNWFLKLFGYKPEEKPERYIDTEWPSRGEEVLLKYLTEHNYVVRDKIVYKQAAVTIYLTDGKYHERFLPGNLEATTWYELLKTAKSQGFTRLERIDSRTYTLIQ